MSKTYRDVKYTKLHRWVKGKPNALREAQSNPDVPMRRKSIPPDNWDDLKGSRELKPWEYMFDRIDTIPQTILIDKFCNKFKTSKGYAIKMYKEIKELKSK